MAHIWHWLADFMGLNFGQDAFSTHMYNFWSGFGGDITEFALVGTIIALYRNHVKNTKILGGILKEVDRSKDVLRASPIPLPHKKDKSDD